MFEKEQKKLLFGGSNTCMNRLIAEQLHKLKSMLLTDVNVTIIQRAILDEDDIQPETSQIQSDTELDV